MSATIENRVVSMEFDNAKFEKGVAETLKSLEKLNDTIEKATGSSSESQKAFSNLAKAFGNVSFDKLAGQIESIAGRFSNMGIVGVTALTHITEKAITAGEQLVKSLSTDQIFAGWNKYNDKTTSVQTIINATGESIDVVNDKLEKLMWFTDETSYDFVDMVNNIGKFTSNGIALDDAVTAMQGIANWAAVSGQNASTASRAMYNLAQSIGMGAVKVQDWMSIENANMATAQFKQAALDAAVATGSLRQAADGTYQTIKGTEVSIENFRTTLQEGWFDSDTLTTVLASYGSVATAIKEISDTSGASATDILHLVDAQKEGTATTKDYTAVLEDSGLSAEELSSSVRLLKDGVAELSNEEYEFGIKAFKAAQEAKTFEDAINATRDAVSSGWMTTFELIFGDYEKAKVLWTDLANDLWDIFASGGEARNALLKEANSGGWEDISKKVVAAGGDLEEFQTRLEIIARRHGVTISSWIKEDGSFVNTLKRSWLETDFVVEALEQMNTGISREVQSADMTMSEFKQIYNDILDGKFGQGTNVVAAQLEELGYNAERVINLKNLMLAGYDISEEKLKGIKQTVVETTRSFDELIEEAQDTESEFGAAINNVAKTSARELFISGAKNVIDSVKGTIDAFKTAWSNVFPSVTADTIRDISEKFHNFSESILEAVTGSDKLQNAFTGAFSIIKSVGSAFKVLLELVKPLGSIFSGLVSILANVLATFGKIITVVHNLTRGFNPLVTIAKAFAGVVETVITTLKKLVAPMANAFGNKVTLKIAHGLTDLIGKLQSFASIVSTTKWQTETAEKVVNKLTTAYNKLINLNWEDLRRSILTKLVDNKNVSADTFRNVVKIFDKIDEFRKSIKNFDIGDSLSDLYKKVSSVFAKLKTSVNDVLSGKQNFGEVISGWFEDIKKWFGEKLDSLTEFFNGENSLADTISEWFKSIFDKSSGDIEDADTEKPAKALSEKISEVVSSAIKFIVGDSSSLSEWLSSILGAIFQNGNDIAGIAKTLAGAFALFQGGKFLKNLGGLGASISGYFDALTAGKKANKFKETAEGIKDIAIAVGILAAALIILANIDSEKAATGAKRMGVVLLEVVAAIALINKSTRLSSFGTDVGKIGKTVLGIAASVLILTVALKKLDGIKDDDFKQGINRLTLMMGEIVLLMAAMNLVNKISTKTTTSALGLVAVAVSIKILVGVIREIEKITSKDGNTIGSAIGVITWLSVLLSMISAVSGLCKFNLSGGLGLMAAAEAIKILVDVVKSAERLASTPENSIWEAVGIVSALGVLLGLMSVGAGLAKFNLKSALGLIGAVGAIYLLALAMQQLEGVQLQPGTLRQLLDIMALVLASMFILSGVLTVLAPALQAIILPLLEFAGVLAALGVAVGATLGAVGIGMQALGSGIEGFNASLSSAADHFNAFLEKIPIALANIQAIADSDVNVLTITKAFTKIQFMLIGELISGIIAGIGGVTYISLTTAVNGLTKCIDAIVSSGIFEKLQIIAGYDMSTTQGAFGTIDALLIKSIPAAFLAGIGDLLGSYQSMSDAATALADCAETIVGSNVFENLANINDQDPEAALEGFEAIKKLINGASVNAFVAELGDIFGDYNSMKEAITALTECVDIVLESNAFEKMIEIGQKDTAQAVLGYTALESLLASTALSGLLTSIGGLIGSYAPMNTAITELGSCIDYILEQDIFNTLKSIGEGPTDEELSNGYKKIQSVLAGSMIDSIIAGVGNLFGNYGKMKTAAKSVADVIETIKSNNIFSTLLTIGQYDQTTINTGLENVKTFLRGMIIGSMGADTGFIVENQAENVQALIDFITKIGPALSIFEGYVPNLTNVVTAMSAITEKDADNVSDVISALFAKTGKGGKTLTDIATENAGVDFSILGVMADAIRKFSSVTSTIQAMSSIDSKGISGFIEGIAELFKKPDEISSISEAGISMMDGLAEGMRSSLNNLTATVDELVNAAMSEAVLWVNTNSPSWNDAGVASAEGFRLGIQSKIQEVANEAAEMVRQAIAAAKAAEKSNSPSKVFRQLGDYAGQGYALGFKDETSNVTNSAASMVNGAVKIAQTTSQLIQNALDSDYVPTITPVIDTSGISSGLSTIGSMTLGLRGVSLASSVSGHMNAIQNAGQNPQIVTLDAKSLSTLLQQYTNDIKANVTVTYNGSMAQLATVLQPNIQVETNRRGMSLIKGAR